MDLISRQDAIDAIENNVSRIGLHDNSEVARYGATFRQHEIIDIIESLPSAQPERKKGEWIPCSERLPEYNVSVLTWDGYAFCIEKRIPYIRDDDGFPIEGDYWVGDEYDDLESDYYPNLRDGACIAWMPLPKPYKEDSAE